MKNIVAAALVVLALAPARAEDLTGRLGVGGAVGAATPIGDKWVANRNDTGLGLGAWLRYGVLPRWTLGLSYDNLAFTRAKARVEALDLNAAYALAPDSSWNPNVHLGLGGGRVHGLPSGKPNVFTADAGLGVDKFIGPSFTLGAAVDWLYGARNSNSGTHEVHALKAGLTAGLWFGGKRPAKVAAAPAPAPAPVAAPAPAPAPAPPPAAVAIALTPASASVAAGASSSFNAAVTGAKDAGVTWSLAPQVGTVSPAGVYTAPASVPVSQDVTVTATSVADPSKKASSVVHLTAPEKVTIALELEFDTAKAVVKPEYDAELKKVAEFLKTYPTTSAEIEGHTDNVGKPEYNKGLSQKRAEAVRQALIERFGVDGSRLTAKGYGEEKPIQDNGTAAGRAKNRRVVATFSATK